MDFTRNWLFIEKPVQDLLSKARVLVVGLGIGSYLSELLVRTGFSQLCLVDGDTVDLSNLNRQNYTAKDVGKYKAEACRNRLISINPDLNLRVISQYADETALPDLIANSDYVVNTIDFDAPIFSLCTRLAQEQGKVELFPINLGFGGAVFIFDKQSSSFESYFLNDKPLKQQILDYIGVQKNISNDLLGKVGLYYEKLNEVGYDPQLGVSSYLTSALMTANLVKIVAGEAVKTFPDFYYSNAFSSVNDGCT